MTNEDRNIDTVRAELEAVNESMNTARDKQSELYMELRTLELVNSRDGREKFTCDMHTVATEDAKIDVFAENEDQARSLAAEWHNMSNGYGMPEYDYDADADGDEDAYEDAYQIWETRYAELNRCVEMRIDAERDSSIPAVTFTRINE